MRTIETEILVLGAGLSGVSAALAAQAAGKKVLVLGRDSGASAMNSGAIDIASDPNPIPGNPQKWTADIRRNIEELLARSPEHPYHLISQSPDEILEHLFKARTLVFPDKDGFITGSENHTQLAFNQLGTFKPTAIIQTRMLNLDDLRETDRALVLGFSGLSDFDPQFFAKNLTHWSLQLGAKNSMDISEIATDNLHDQSTLQFSKWLGENLERFLEDTMRAVRAVKASLVILPPVIPGGQREEILNRLEKTCAVRVRELLSLPPSVPGKRLVQYLEQRVAAQGIERIPCKATGFEAAGGKVISVMAECGLEKIKISARAFILAAGSFLAGGIVKDEEFREPVFGLDIFCGNKPLGKIFTEKLTSVKLTSPHPLFAVGLKADREMRVLDRDGKIVFANLFAAGSILAGGNYIFDGSGGGLALAAGFKAGEKSISE